MTVNRIVTFTLVCGAFVIFRSPNLGTAGDVLSAIGASPGGATTRSRAPDPICMAQPGQSRATISAPVFRMWTSLRSRIGAEISGSFREYEPPMPQPMGVLRAVSRPTVDALAREQEEEAARKQPPDLEGLLRSGDVWTVEAQA